MEIELAGFRHSKNDGKEEHAVPLATKYNHCKFGDFDSADDCRLYLQPEQQRKHTRISTNRRKRRVAKVMVVGLMLLVVLILTNVTTSSSSSSSSSSAMNIFEKENKTNAKLLPVRQQEGARDDYKLWKEFMAWRSQQPSSSSSLRPAPSALGPLNNRSSNSENDHFQDEDFELWQDYAFWKEQERQQQQRQQQAHKEELERDYDLWVWEELDVKNQRKQHQQELQEDYELWEDYMLWKEQENQHYIEQAEEKEMKEAQQDYEEWQDYMLWKEYEANAGKEKQKVSMVNEAIQPGIYLRGLRFGLSMLGRSGENDGI